MNCQECEELLGAYALEALSDEEREAVESHLADCSKCMRSAQQLQEVVNLFPLSVPAVEPPAYLKERILARIQASQEVPPPSVRPQKAALPGNFKQRFLGRSSLLAATIFLLLILLIGMFGWNLVLRQQVSQLSSRVPPPVTYAIRGANQSATATGEVIYYPQQHITVLILHGLPTLTGTQVYQGWVLQGKQPTSIGLFNVQQGIATLDFPGDLRGYDAAAVSLEKGPRASNNAPGGPIVAVGSLKTV